MTGDETLRQPAQKAIDFIAQAQYPDGGWRYKPAEECNSHEMRSDTSVTGWQLTALHTAQAAKLDVPPLSFELANHYLDSTRHQDGALYSYQPRQAPKHAMTAEALLCRIYSGWSKDRPALMEGVQYLADNHMPSKNNTDMYYWYYATQTFHHIGGSPWSDWNTTMRDILVNTQEKSGNHAGSWAPRGGHASAGGRLYMTSLAICTLEVYYRHLPVFRQIDIDRQRAAAQKAIIALSWPLTERRNAALWIDGESKWLPDVGDAILPFAVTPGTHTVRVDRQGYLPNHFHNIRLIAGQSKTLSLAWQSVPEEAFLVFSWPLSERVDATLRIGGQEKPLPADGDVTVRFTVSPGKHSVTVERKGFEPIVVPNIQLSTGQSRNVPLQWRPPLAVAPFDEAQAKAHQKAWADHLGLDVEITNSIGMRLVLIPPGEFLMGSPESEENRITYEYQHRVRITTAYFLGACEVTESEYEQVMGINPSRSSSVPVEDTSRFPVATVSWDDAVAFCRKLSALPEEQRAGRVYRLPTEAEWEFACRAGTTSAFHYGDSLSSTQANFDGYYPYGGASKGPDLSRPTQVGSYKASAWALYDMHGNVWEWCLDWYDGEYYRNSPVDDPRGPPQASLRVLRGGSWHNSGRNCRSAYRHRYRPDGRDIYFGFRVALSR